MIVGANACGKSTLLRGLARLLQARGGHGAARRRRHPRAARPKERGDAGSGSCRSRRSRRRGSRSPTSSPAAATRTRRWFRQWRPRRRGGGRRRAARDRHARPRASGRSTSCRVASASACGSRWRSRRAPTSCCSTSRRRSSTSPTRSRCSTCSSTSTERDGRTIVLVLHDLNQACRYAHHLIAMRDGAIVAEGPPAEIVTRGARAARCSSCAAGSSPTPCPGRRWSCRSAATSTSRWSRKARDMK